jgi:thiamine kinase-like enzyme
MELGPRTFCHLDLHPGSLFATDGQIVLIDWTLVALVASEPSAKMPAT